MPESDTEELRNRSNPGQGHPAHRTIIQRTLHVGLTYRYLVDFFAVWALDTQYFFPARLQAFRVRMDACGESLFGSGTRHEHIGHGAPIGLTPAIPITTCRIQSSPTATKHSEPAARQACSKMRDPV
jgi:hypothetical protein